MSHPVLPDAGAVRPRRSPPGPWALEVRPDRGLALLVGAVGLALLAGAVVALSEVPLVAAGTAAWLCGLTARAVWGDALRGGAGTRGRVELAADGTVWFEGKGRGWQARLAPGSRTLGAWVLLRLEGGGGAGVQSILLSPGACDPQALRRLRTALRWGMRIPLAAARGSSGRGTSGGARRSGNHGPDATTVPHARAPAARGGA
ncbi:MAG: hypothetical protein ACK5TE_15680 [Pseudomonadota bacterium]